MFILPSIFSGIGFWLVKHALIYKNSELKVFKNIIFLGETSSNWPKDLLETNIFYTFEFC